MIRFFRELFFRKKIDQIIVDRRGSYTTTFGKNEELPLDVWAYLTKRRANFRCEDCGEKGDLDAHHIKRPGDGGRNILRNGRCLCGKCHPRYKISLIGRRKREEKVRRELIGAFGFEKGIEVLERYKNCKTRKEIGILVEDLSKEDPKGLVKWL